MANYVIISVVANLVIALITYLCECNKIKKDESYTRKFKANYYINFFIIAIVQIVLILMLTQAVCQNTIYGKLFTDYDFSVFLFVILTSLGASLGWFLPKQASQDSPKSSKFFKRISLCAVAVLMLEILVFNGVSFNDNPTQTTIPLESITYNKIAVRDDKVPLESASSATIVGEGTNVHSIKLKFSGEDTSFVTTVMIKDDNNTVDFKSVAQSTLNAKNRYAEMSISPYGTLHEIKLSFTAIDAPTYLEEVVVSSSKTFNFNNFRFLGVLLICALICAIDAYSLMKIRFNPKSVPQNVLIWSLCALLISYIGLFKDYSSEDAELRKEYPVEIIAYEDPFTQTFDAFQKGQLHLDVKVEESLLELEDPYDVGPRTDAYWLWDRAYYEGKYYSYFGVAPVITFWYPYYHATGYLPTVNTAVLTISVFSIIALFGALLEFVRRYCPKVSFVALFVALLSSVFTCGMMFPLYNADAYHLPFAFAACYLLFALWSALASARVNNNIIRIVLLFLSGTFFILTVGSRPSIAVGAVLIIPALISMLASKNYKKIIKASGVASFVLPILIGGAALMKYNEARFGSYFDFGIAYQLTVCNVTLKELEITQLPAALFHYIFCQPNFANDFPYSSAKVIGFANYGHYAYIEHGFGIFAYLPILIGMICMPIIIKRKSCTLEKKTVYISSLIICIIVAWIDFCFGGYNIRYIADITIPAALVATLVILEALGAVQQSERFSIIRRPATIGITIAFIQPIILTLLFMCNYPHMIFNVENPWAYKALKDLIIFWR